MASTFMGLNTGLSGLNYFQSALNTTSHNISNANTKGYSRQQVLATAADPTRLNQSAGMMGSGVLAKNVERQRSAFYDTKYWNANSRYSKYTVEKENLEQLQTYMNEMTGNSGYTKWISQLSTALQDIADNPSDYTTRISYTLTADSFTDIINEMSNNFQKTQKSINDEIELVVSEVNSLAKQIYELTQQIINVELKGANANDLRDKRGVCIDKLSEYVYVEVEERSIMYGVGVDQVPSTAETLSVRIGGNILCDEMEYNELMVVPREENINQNDVEGLVDVYWKNSDGTAGSKFEVLHTEGRLCGLFEVRDGNNLEGFSGEIVGKTDAPPSVQIKLENSININKLTIPSQGLIVLNGKEYMYDGWTAENDADGNLNNFVFNNLTMFDDKRVVQTAVIPDSVIGYKGHIGDNISTKGIPYYQARLNEMVRVFSDYMNRITTSGADEEGRPGLDMFTAEDVYGNDYVLTGTISGAGTIASSDVSYYKLTSMNWELNSAWKEDPSRVVVSYLSDVEQGNKEARPIIDKIIFGLTDQNMFSQGNVSHFMQAVTTNMAVDIAKVDVFASNSDDIRYVIDNQRTSVAGVDENEEAADLTKFENLYRLASQVISVLNKVYDKLINDTGR